MLDSMKSFTITANTLHSLDYLYGFSVRATVAASVNIRETGVAGDILFVLDLATDESATIVLPSPIGAEDGIYVQVATGTVFGVLLGR